MSQEQICLEAAALQQWLFIVLKAFFLA